MLRQCCSRSFGPTEKVYQSSPVQGALLADGIGNIYKGFTSVGQSKPEEYDSGGQRGILILLPDLEWSSNCTIL